LFLVLSLSLISKADNEGLLNKLLAPGPLIEGHKNLEGKDCLKCHEAGKGISEEKCMSCHKEIKPFIDSKKGFHGLAAKNQSCIQCHADHKGRKFDTTVIDQKNFDHLKLTGYGLEGKHAKIKCQECHTDKRGTKPIRPKEIRFLGTKASSCRSCHKKDDVHLFKGDFEKKDCNVCHGNVSWKENVKFNHDTDTKYKLVERHAELKCNECHLKDKKKKVFQYKWDHLNQKQCLTCHQDFHKNRLGAKYTNGQCTTCHTQRKWSIANFDHEITGYKLLGKHKEAQCVDCHKPNKGLILNSKNKISKLPAIKDLNFTGLKKQCLSCHQDFHKFGTKMANKMGDLNQCSKCHDENDWKKTHYFDHNVHTVYPIEGKHLELKCADCHLPRPKNKKIDDKNLKLDLKLPTYHWAQLNSKTCETCHNNPHIGEFSKDLLSKKCTVCHTAEDWFIQKSETAFDHSKTRFQLTGSHKTTSCKDCHGESGKKKFKFTSVDQKFCIDCHNNIHEKQFVGKWNLKDCSQCHSTEKFSPLLKFDHNLTNYQLKGEHEKLKCSECHTSSNEKYNLKWPNYHTKNHQEPLVKPMAVFNFPNLKAKSCRQCHEDYHVGQLGQNCTQCHSEKSWKPTSFDHNKQSRFQLIAKHMDVKCEKCHTPINDKIKFKNEIRNVVKFKPVSTQCVDCHKDPHKGNFGKTCQECHTEKNWRSTKDFHKNFTLSGVHYTLECSECHKDGKKLAGLSQQCIACHQKDDVHNGSTPNCKDCHTQHFWEITSFRHSLTKFPLRGAHRVIECTDCHNNGIYKGLSSSCVTCHLSDFTANPGPHTSGNTSCIDCHKNTFTFGSAQ
jgi:hypothetical protein